MKLTFAQFEKASNLLEKSPIDVTDAELLENGFTREELEKINEGFFGDLFGGVFKGFKEKILKMVPGSVLKKADNILKEYKDAKVGIYKKTINERNKLYKASVEMQENPTDETAKRRFEEMKIRSEKAIQQIELANKSRIEAIEKKLRLLVKDKGDTVKDYVDFQTAQIQEDIANQQLKDAEENASDEILTQIENEVKEAKRKKEEAAKAIEDAKIKDKEDADKKEKEAADKAAADKVAADKAAADKAAEEEKQAKLNAKQGQIWTRTNSDNIDLEIEILKAEDGYVSEWKVTKEYKNKKGETIKAGRVFKNAPFSVEQLKKLVN